MQIDRQTYNKTLLYPAGMGYGPGFRDLTDIESIIIHSTNSPQQLTTFPEEANYLYKSNVVSSHFLIGKEGQIVEFLDPKWVAWHAGWVSAPKYNNKKSIGIENHARPGDLWTNDQIQALTDLVSELLSQMPHIQSIVAHRDVAVFAPGTSRAGQLGRKIDPSGHPFDSESYFNAWVKKLLGRTNPRFEVIASTVNIRTAPQKADNNIAGHLYKGNQFETTSIRIDENNQYIGTSRLWAHVTTMLVGDKSAENLGFVHVSNLREL